MMKLFGSDFIPKMSEGQNRSLMRLGIFLFTLLIINASLGVPQESLPLPDSRGQIITKIFSNNSTNPSIPADKLDSGASFDIGPITFLADAIQNNLLRHTFQRLYWILNKQLHPGYSQRIMRPPRISA